MMYAPPAFKNKNTNQLHAFIKRYDFCTMISHANSINVSHLPLILLPDQGEHGTLLGHMARANQHWKDFDGTRSALCIFHGPHAYISPTWYKNKPEVPTWNYAVVHAHGIPTLIDDKNEFAKLMDQTLNHFEPALYNPESPTHIPDAFRNSLLDYIVGFKIEIQELTGKFKLGQNRSDEDQRGLLEGLSRQDDNNSQQLAEFIKGYRGSTDKT